MYGDATHIPVLEDRQTSPVPGWLSLPSPIMSPAARLRARIKELNPHLHLIVRTRFVSEIDPLHELGADEVIPEEFETAVEIFIRVLNHYLVPQQEIDRFMTEVRADGYQMLRSSRVRWYLSAI